MDGGRLENLFKDLADGSWREISFRGRREGPQV